MKNEVARAFSLNESQVENVILCNGQATNMAKFGPLELFFKPLTFFKRLIENASNFLVVLFVSNSIYKIHAGTSSEMYLKRIFEAVLALSLYLGNKTARTQTRERNIKCIRARNTHDTKLKLQSAHNSVAVQQ